MEAKIQKWGNSLAIRIPKSFAKEAKIEYDSDVELTIENESLVITPVKPKEYKLDDMLQKINKKNLHSETGFGNHHGKETI